MEFEGLEMGVLKVPSAKSAPAPSPTVPKLCLMCPPSLPFTAGLLHGEGLRRERSKVV